MDSFKFMMNAFSQTPHLPQACLGLQFFSKWAEQIGLDEEHP